VVSFFLAFPPISYMHSSSPPFVLHALHWIRTTHIFVTRLSSGSRHIFNVH
jgi:hypothetical protein